MKASEIHYDHTNVNKMFEDSNVDLYAIFKEMSRSQMINVMILRALEQSAIIA